MSRNLKQKSKRIKDLPLSLRPQEKMFDKGVENLTEAELLAILIGTGTAKQNAIVLAKSLLNSFPLKKFSTIKISDIIKFQGIGQSKAARILAALELGERIFAPSLLTKVTIRTAEDLLEQVKDIADKKQEYLLVFYLNARHELLQKEIVGQGSLNNMLITPREVFAPALVVPCASIIVVHNHPSGDPTPSDNDIGFTKRIHEAGEVMGIPLIDHVIVAKSGYFSFRDNKGRDNS
jgi:DNA repair protein RadC